MKSVSDVVYKTNKKFVCVCACINVRACGQVYFDIESFCRKLMCIQYRRLETVHHIRVSK